MVKEITWSPATVSVAVGSSLELIPTVGGTDYRTLEGSACEDVLYEIADTGVATLAVEEGPNGGHHSKFWNCWISVDNHSDVDVFNCS